MRYKFYEDNDGTTTQIWFDGDITMATIVDRDGLHANGNARRHPDDNYEQWLGETIAVARAQQRYAKKVEKIALRSTVK